MMMKNEDDMIKNDAIRILTMNIAGFSNFCEIDNVHISQNLIEKVGEVIMDMRKIRDELRYIGRND